MAYTNNTPQATQTIAFTQPLIENNFMFLDTGIGTEHNFNASGTGSDMYHLQASMPNLSGGDPIALPAGTNGEYYVLGGVPKFYNTSAQFIQLNPVTSSSLTGTVSLSTVNTTVATLPANSVGQYYLFKKGSSSTVAISSGTGFVLTDVDSITVGSSTTFNPNINIAVSGLDFKARTTSATYNGIYTYLFILYNP